jgi:two-component system LytT family response regulator
VRAFDVQAVDYLLKPFGDARFHSALERAKAHLRVRRLARQMADALGAPAEPPPPSRCVERLVVRDAGRLWSLPVEDIAWIEAQDYYAQVHAAGRAHLLRMSLSRLLARLDPRSFVRIHRSTIVNVLHVKELEPLFHGEYLVRLRDGTGLKLSRTFKDQLDRVLGT